MGLFGHMRSITVKLTLAFLLVGITGAVLVAAIVLRRTRAAFDLFLLDRDQQALVDRLVQYYQINQSWDGLAESSLGFQIDRGKPSTNHDFRSQVERFTLVGADGLVLFSLDREQVGEKLTSQELSNAISLVVDGENAGWLLLTTNPQPRPDKLVRADLLERNQPGYIDQRTDRQHPGLNFRWGAGIYHDTLAA